MPELNTGEAGVESAARRRSMELFAKATLPELQGAWEALAEKPEVSSVRGPETGLVMVRGRIGGGGAPFNLGEATVSRATVRLEDGLVGHGQALGTDLRKVRLAAIFDALMQRAVPAPVVTDLLEAVEARIAGEDGRKTRQAAATRVDFFTMVRGED